jgi:Tfp pilus assembly protein PilZ
MAGMNKNQWPLSIRLRKDLHEVVVTAKVAWINLQGGKGNAGMGLEFVDPPAILKEAILRIVNRIAVVEPQNR